jgi:hypothetical protein
MFVCVCQIDLLRCIIENLNHDGFLLLFVTWSVCEFWCHARRGLNGVYVVCGNGTICRCMIVDGDKQVCCNVCYFVVIEMMFILIICV